MRQKLVRRTIGGELEEHDLLQAGLEVHACSIPADRGDEALTRSRQFPRWGHQAAN
jgi:hypothetical protein